MQWYRGFREAVQGREDAGWDELFGWYWSGGGYHEWTRSLVEAAFYERPEDRIGRAAAPCTLWKGAEKQRNEAGNICGLCICAFSAVWTEAFRTSPL